MLLKIEFPKIFLKKTPKIYMVDYERDPWPISHLELNAWPTIEPTKRLKKKEVITL